MCCFSQKVWGFSQRKLSSKLYGDQILKARAKMEQLENYRRSARIGGGYAQLVPNPSAQEDHDKQVPSLSPQLGGEIGGSD